MAIQSHTPVIIGTGTSPNLVGDWSVLIPLVTNTSVWAVIHYWFTSAASYSAVQLELGIGPTGSEVRKWKSFWSGQGGNDLEFDDSGHTKYIPFNFPKDVQVSARFARLGSVTLNLEIQLQLYS